MALNVFTIPQRLTDLEVAKSGQLSVSDEIPEEESVGEAEVLAAVIQSCHALNRNTALCIAAVPAVMDSVYIVTRQADEKHNRIFMRCSAAVNVMLS